MRKNRSFSRRASAGAFPKNSSPINKKNCQVMKNRAVLFDMLHRATRPKLSSVPSGSLRAADKPTPSAMIKGTVMGPVVTPPESKATEVKLDGEKRKEQITGCNILPAAGAG